MERKTFHASEAFFLPVHYNVQTNVWIRHLHPFLYSSVSLWYHLAFRGYIYDANGILAERGIVSLVFEEGKENGHDGVVDFCIYYHSLYKFMIILLISYAFDTSLTEARTWITRRAIVRFSTPPTTSGLSTTVVSSLIPVPY